jgi:hypothetical protein
VICGARFFSPDDVSFSDPDLDRDLEKPISEFIRIKSKNILKYSFIDLFRRGLTLFLVVFSKFYFDWYDLYGNSLKTLEHLTTIFSSRSNNFFTHSPGTFFFSSPRPTSI